MGDTSHTAYQYVILWFGGIVGLSGPDRHYAYAYARLVLPTCFAHRWLAGVSFSTLVEPSVATPGLEKVKTTLT